MSADRSNYIEVLKQFPAQCRNAMGLAKGTTVPGEIGTVVVTGMGGSAIGGDLLKSFMHDTDVPVFVNRDYKVPNFVDEYSLVFVISYSGNTEETLSAYEDAKSRGAKIVAITSGGKLAELCDKVIKIPEGMQPRAALGYLFFPMLGVLYNKQLADVKNTDLNETLAALKNTENYEDMARELVKKIGNRVPIIYSSDLLGGVAYRWRTQFHENSKFPAFHNVFSELDHNEILSFAGMDRQKFVVIMLRDDNDNPKIVKRMDITRDLIEDRVDVIEVPVQGKSLLTRMFSTIYLGDMASYYQAIKNHVDPAPVEIIEMLKKKLAE